MALLFSDSETFQKERPIKATDKQIEDFYKRIAKEFTTEGFTEADEDDIIEALKDISPFRDNGYELAKKLERYHKFVFDIDVSFCERLEHLEYEYSNINDENVKTWVKAHNPQPLFPVGSKLIVNTRFSGAVKLNSIVYITGIREDTANYYINEDKDGNGGYVMAYELIESNCSITE